MQVRESTSFVSFVTPFYNTRGFLAECIESVLRQTYQNWEYVLVDNCSTDGSSEIAETYAAQCDRIRLARTDRFLPQVQNYNFAISCISPNSRYWKLVQADDWIFPDCVRSMVEVAEAHPRVGIVGAYALEGDRVTFRGIPYPIAEMTGREVCRMRLLDQGKYVFGTPTSLLVRSELLKSRVPFYEERYAPNEDFYACFDLLRTWNFGFVHQVLTYSRQDEESIWKRVLSLGALFQSNLGALVTYGRDYLSEEEYNTRMKQLEREYFLFLGQSVLKGRSQEFWKFHREGLALFNYRLDWRLLSKWTSLAFFEYLANPKRTWDSFSAHRNKISSLPSRTPLAGVLRIWSDSPGHPR